MNLYPTNKVYGGRIDTFRRMVCAGIFLLAAGAVARAQVTVQTIGGGVRAECGRTYGFVAGNTWMHAQFDQPYASALDSQGDLWVADKNNSDIEMITAAGDRTSSTTFQYESGGSLHKFPNVIGVAIDASDNLYVLTTTNLTKFVSVTTSFPILNPQFEFPLSMFVPGGTATAITVANDAANSIYITFTTGATGAIIRIPQPYPSSPLFSTIVSGFPFNPAGITLRQDGLLAVTDTKSNAVYTVSTSAGSTPTLVAGGHGVGWINGGPTLSSFDQPRGIAASADGRMVVCDTMNNALRVIDTSFNTTTLYGTPSNVWTRTCCSCSPALYAGWVDGTSGSTSTSASGREPVSVTISPSGTLFVTELYYNLLRSVTGSDLTPATSGSSSPGGTGSTNLGTVTTQMATDITSTSATLNATVNANGSATQVYFAYGTTTNVSSWSNFTATVDLTTDLSGTNTVSEPITNLQPNIPIFYQAVANNNGGTTYGGVRSFQPSTTTVYSSTNQMGFLHSESAGIGATVYLPLVLELTGGVQVTNLQFRVEVTPSPPNTTPVSGMSLMPITTNDFVQLTGPAAPGAFVNYTFLSYTNSSNGLGMLVFAAPGSGINVQNYATLGLLTFQIPDTAVTNQAYSLNVILPSTGSINLGSMNQTLTVATLPYLAGDSSPANGYDAQEFGDGVLDNGDVVNAIYASLGYRVPPLYSDAYNAMDVYPQESGFTENGDGVIDIRDWNLILLRSVGLNQTNWIRYWTNGGNLYGVPVTDPLGLPGNPDPVFAGMDDPPPGQVWTCQAVLSAGTAINLSPGQTCSLPVSVKVQPGQDLTGLQFRAIVTPNGNGPAVGQVQFNPAPGLPTPMSFNGPAPNDVLEAWQIGAFTTPLQNSNYLGTITFQIPATALPGQSYAVHFTGVDGASDMNTEKAMESFPGHAWVKSAVLQTPSITSDEWKIHFFGSLASALAGDNVDADGDGAPNWQEYLAGTDPTDAQSVFKFSGASVVTNGVHKPALNWLTAPGKTYILESKPVLGAKGWTAISTNVGDGYTCQFIQNNYKGNSVFYRILLQP